MQPFRFGIQLNGAESGPAWRDLARKIESLGYSTLFVPDHFGDQWAPTVALSLAAAATDTLKVGALVYDNDYRHPVVLAKEMATLDLATGGDRVEIGLGAGWMKSDYDEAGMTYDEPIVRVKRFEEGVTIIQALVNDGSCTFAGEHYSITGGQGVPRPATVGGPKWCIGGGGKRVLSFAAQHADIIGVNANLKAGYVGPEVAATTTAQRFDERIGWIKEAAGDRFDSLELQILTFACSITDDRMAFAEMIAPMFGVDPAGALEMPMALVGTETEIEETLLARRERYGFSYYVLHEAEIDTFAPIVARLTGK